MFRQVTVTNKLSERKIPGPKIVTGDGIYGSVQVGIGPGPGVGPANLHFISPGPVPGTDVLT